MSAFSEVCGGAAGVQRGGIDLADEPMALMGGAAPLPLPKAVSSSAPANPGIVSVSRAPSVAAAAVMLRPDALQPQPLAPSRSANGSSVASATDVGKIDTGVNAAQAAAAPSRIPSDGLSRIPSFGR
jgi:hypothetical protein